MMRNIEDLTSTEVEQMKKSADAFYEKHKAHVNRLVQTTESFYPPSGSDMLNPSLWKPAHWRWHLDEITEPPKTRTDSKDKRPLSLNHKNHPFFIT